MVPFNDQPVPDTQQQFTARQIYADFVNDGTAGTVPIGGKKKKDQGMLKKNDFLNYDDSVIEAAAAAARASIKRQAKSSDKSGALRSTVNVGGLRLGANSR